MVQLKIWGAEFKDGNDVIGAFNKFDDNKGGIMLFDEFIKFSE